MVESLFCMAIISMLLLLCIPIFHRVDLNSESAIALTVYETQLDAMIEKENQTYETIYFNEYGHISHGATIYKDRFKIVFQLGNGRFYIE